MAKAVKAAEERKRIDSMPEGPEKGKALKVKVLEAAKELHLAKGYRP
jgi:hypothetical protein